MARERRRMRNRGLTDLQLQMHMLRFRSQYENQLVVREGREVPKRRKVYSLAAFGSGLDFSVHNSDVHTTARGLMERVFFVSDPEGGFREPPQPDVMFRARLAQFYQRLVRRMPSTTPLTDEQFVAQYRGRKRAVYQRAVDELRKVRPLNRSDSYLSTFVKAEKLNLSAKEDPAPRVIQPRTPRYNVEVGKYLKPIEHRLYKAINSLFGKGDTVVVKGLNAAERGKLISSKWGKFRKPVAVGLDASRFDQHVSVAALLWEHSVYVAIYRNDPYLARILSWQRSNRGFVRCPDGTIEYRKAGSRMSGDMNTAMGNVLLMCAMMWSYMRQECPGVKYEFVNDGDDCILVVEQGDLHRLNSLVGWFHNMGFTMIREPPVFELEHVEFCQAQPVYDDRYRHHVMIRDPRVTTTKDLVSVRPIQSAQHWETYCKAVGECGISLAGATPIKSQFYQALLRCKAPSRDSRTYQRNRKARRAKQRANGVLEESGMVRLSLGMQRKILEPSAEARFSFWKAFGFTPDHQTALESELRKTNVEWRRIDEVHIFPYRNHYVTAR